jgi:amino acid transporter
VGLTLDRSNLFPNPNGGSSLLPVSPQMRMCGTNCLDGAADFNQFLVGFQLFAPSVLGVAGGLNMAANLKDPAYAVPWGTLGATVVSAVFMFLTGMAVVSFVSALPYALQGLRCRGRCRSSSWPRLTSLSRWCAIAVASPGGGESWV